VTDPLESGPPEPARPESGRPESGCPEPAAAIVTDLDGTLLTSDKRITPRTRAALTAARDAGLAVAAATARPWRLAADALGDALPLFDAVIVSNGAAVLAARGQRVLSESLLSADAARAAVATLRGHWPDAGLGWELGHAFASDARFREIAASQRILRDVDAGTPLAAPRSVVHQLVLARPGVEPAELVAEAATLLGAAFAVTDSSGGVVEISLAAATKATAARSWAALRGVERLIAFGDERNDLELLASASLGVAMAGSAPAVVAAATLTAPSNDDDGVARVIERLLDGDPAVRGAFRVVPGPELPDEARA
jgi:5-amino-6-(5-phospho-D-ribitylamino)uracil phosphatase